MHDIRQNKNHIVIIDGTLSRLDRGFETHCGKLFKLAMKTDGARRRVYYDPGVQGQGLYKWINVASGNGLNKSIIRSYRKLSENYSEGDKIYLFGYSRGAYAVRLLAGMIEKMGLLAKSFATPALAEQSFILYANNLPQAVLSGFHNKYCIKPKQIDFLGVWDTVKALGLPIPIVSRFSPLGIAFRDSALSQNVRVACQALSYHENRRVYRPELWQSHAPSSSLKQVLFAGTHSVVGGQVGDDPSLAALSNFSLHWMLEQASIAQLELPSNWKQLYPAKINSEAHFKNRKWLNFWIREPRRFIPEGLFLKNYSLETYLHKQTH